MYGSGGARTFGVIAMSVSAHIVFFAVMGLAPSPDEVFALGQVEMEIIEPEPEIEEPEPEPEPEEPPEPEPEPEPEPAKPPPRQARTPPPPTAEPPPNEQPPPPEEIADFTGETLTAEGAGSWTSVVGRGGALDGPVGKIGRVQASGPVQRAAKAAPSGPRVVPLGSLKRRPSPPPGLEELLVRAFPPRARQQGVEGKAVLAVRVLPSGRLTRMRIVKEWPAGFDFGAACRRMLSQAPPFQPPLDRAGTPVAADIKFHCDFEISY